MQRYFSKELIQDHFILSLDDKYHITTVMRMKNGDKIEIVYNEELYIGQIEDINNFKVKLLKKEEITKDKRPNVILCIPLLKEQKIDYILQKATELGVNEIVPIILERSIIKIDEKAFAKKKERWIKIVKEASEQSKRVDIPVIKDIHKIKDLNNFNGLKIVCSTQEKENNIKKMLKNIKNNIIFVIGPEGGISPKEEKELNELGFISTSLGSRIMRVETVPLYLMSIVKYEFME